MQVAAILMAIGSIISWLVKKFLTKGLILSFQFFVASSLVGFFITLYGFAITSLVWIYNKAHAIFYAIQNDMGGSLHCVSHVLACSGVSPVFNAFFSEFWSLLMTILILKLMWLTRTAIMLISNELFKLGVLMGQ